MSDWWRAEVNGAEIYRGPWSECSDAIIYLLTDRMTHQQQTPLAFNVRIGRARTVHVPGRQRLAGDSLERYLEREAQS